MTANNHPPRWGEPAPFFECRSPVNPRFQFDTVAGRYIVLCFYGTSTDPESRAVLNGFLANRGRFDDETCCFFAVCTDPDDEKQSRVGEHLPGLHLFWDFDQSVSRLYGCVLGDEGGGVERFLPQTFILDERQRVVVNLPFQGNPQSHLARVLEVLDSLPPLSVPAIAANTAPILVVPRIFEQELCDLLIQYYDQRGGVESGFMRDVDGKTALVQDHSHKRRRDQEILDESLRNACVYRIHDRLVPEIKKAFQFSATRIERYIVACYDSHSGGHFRAHRDNTTKGTAHRKFAVSLNLNTGDYDGGMVWFPEYGRQRYTAPRGGAVVFSCSILHEATPVKTGSRYVFLPFLYDDEGARIRQENAKFLESKL